jgi:hypothetical protein
MSEPNSTTTSPNNNSTGNNQQQQYHNWCMKNSPEHSPTNAGVSNVPSSSSLQYHQEEQQEHELDDDDIVMCPSSPPLVPRCSPCVLENGPKDFNWLPQTDIEAAAQILALERETLSLRPTECINDVRTPPNTDSAATTSTTATRRLCRDTSPFTSPNAQSNTGSIKKKL